MLVASGQDLKLVVNWITQANGSAVITHPTIYKFTSNKLNKLINDFKAAGGKAIEVVNQPKHCTDINGMAQRTVKNEIYASMGSDFHRPEQSWRELGWLAPMPQTVTTVWDIFREPLQQA